MTSRLMITAPATNHHIVRATYQDKKENGVVEELCCDMTPGTFIDVNVHSLRGLKLEELPLSEAIVEKPSDGVVTE